MFWAAVGDLLPVAVVIAANPLAIAAVVLLLGGRTASAGATGFGVGWMAGLATLTGLVVVLASALGADTSPAWLDVVRVVIGAALAFLGVRSWIRRPRSGDEREAPSWMRGLASLSAARAAATGFVLAAAAPRNIAPVAGTASVISQDALGAGQAVAAAAVLVVVGSSSVLGCLGLARFGGTRGRAALDGVDRFMADHGAAIVAAVLVVIGVKILGDGMAGLGAR